MPSEMPPEAPIDEPPQPPQKFSTLDILKSGFGCLGALLAVGAVLWVVVLIVGPVAGFVTGIFGGIANGILTALDGNDFITWYFTSAAQIDFDPDYCFGDAQQVASCNAWNLGAKYAVQTWNEIMLHQSARIIVAFIFPIVAAAVTKKCVDEIWESFKKKSP